VRRLARRAAVASALLSALAACTGGVYLGGVDGGGGPDDASDAPPPDAAPAVLDAGRRTDATCNLGALPTCPPLCSDLTCTTNGDVCRREPSGAAPEECTCADRAWSCRATPSPPEGCSIDCVVRRHEPRPPDCIPDGSDDHDC
jgi:hypothetical protein